MTRRKRSGRLGGDLGELGLPELIQTLHHGRKTARIVLRAGRRQGEVWIRGGEVAHAATATLFGDLAVYEMLEWNEGQFAVEYGVETETRSITQDPTFLVLEGLRRIDERPRPSPDPTATSSAPPPGRTIAAAVFATVLVMALAALNLVGAPGQAEAVVTPAPQTSVVAEKKPPAKKPASSKKRAAKPAAVPLSPVVPEPALMLDSMEPATVPTASTLIVSGKSSGTRGAIVLLVDGKPVYTHHALDAATSFETTIHVAPGEHLLVARLDGRDVYAEDSVQATFNSGESRKLRITASRAFVPMRLNLERAAKTP